MHETRNLAQHQGDAPSYETVIKYQGYVKDFLVKCFKDLFGLEFDNVYSSILVSNEKIREVLVQAEQNLESNNFKESMKSSAKVFAYLKLQEREDFSRESLRFFTAFGLIDDHTDIRVPKIHSFDRIERQVYDKVQRCLDDFVSNLNTKLKERARKINEFAEAVEDELAILKLGVDYKEFRLFNKVSPGVFFHIGSSEPTVSDTDESNYSKENALFCYDFVLNLALRLQNIDNANGGSEIT